MLSEKIAAVVSQFGVGAVAAIATAPPSWIGLIVSCATISSSVLLSGVVQHWLHRSSYKKDDSEAVRNTELSQGEHLKNTSRLLDLKESEIQSLRFNIETLQRQVNEMREELAAIKNENAQLTLLLGSKLKDLIQVQSLKDVFEAMSDGEKADD